MAIVLLLPFVLGLLALAGVFAAGRWYVSANPARLAGMVRSGGSFALVLAGVFLVVRGQVVLGGSLVMAGLGRLSQGRAPRGGGGRGQTRRAGQASTVRTARLDARLDHDSGEIDALILAGPHEGKRLSGLSASDVLEVWADCQGDSDSRLIVEAYLDRRFPDWREDAERDRDTGARGTGGTGGGSAMSVDDAYEILGLQPGASEAEIRASYRRLMKQAHPDHGGSTFLAAKINEAKDLLLRRR